MLTAAAGTVLPSRCRVPAAGRNAAANGLRRWPCPPTGRPARAGGTRSGRQCVGRAASPALRASSFSSSSPAASRASTAVNAAAATPPPPPGAPVVVLTREAGKNGKLAAALAAKGLATVELPLVRSGPAADTALLPAVLMGGGFDWVVVTSPEAAAVFLNAWKEGGRPAVSVAAVGAGTARVLEAAPGGDAPPVAFTPSLANAVTLAAELPARPPTATGPVGDDGAPPTVLYPASAKAGSDLADGLAARGIMTARLNTYDTLPVPADDLDGASLASARGAAVVSLASPSAVRAWVAAVGGLDAANAGPAVAAIGATTGEAARKLGLTRVHWPAAPGMDGFVEAIEEALAAHAGAA